MNLILIFSSVSLAADEASEDNRAYTLQNAENPTLKKSLEVLEKTQQTVGRYVYTAGEKIDLFFGDEEADIEQRGSQLKVQLPTWFYEDGNYDSSLQFRVQLDLPRTNHSWNLFITSYQQGVAETNQGYIETDNSTQEAKFQEPENDLGSIGVFYNLLEERNILAKFDFGINIEGPTNLNPFIRLSGRYNKDLSQKWNSRLYQSVFLESYRGFAWDLRQIFDYEMDSSHLFRSQTSAEWWHGSDFFGVNQKELLFHKINSRRVLAYYGYVQWDNSPGDFELTEIAVGINLREKLYKDWLYGEIEPKLTSRAENNFSNAYPSIMFMLEMQFYDAAK